MRIIKVLQRPGGERAFFLLAGQVKAFSAARNGDIQRCLDLPQIFIERATQGGQPMVIDRREENFQGGGFHAAIDSFVMVSLLRISPRKVKRLASTILSSTNCPIRR